MDILEYFQSPETAAKILLLNILGVELKCRECGKDLAKKVSKTFLEGRQVQCRHCGWKGFWSYGTICHSSKLSCQQMLALVMKNTLPDTIVAQANALDVSVSTILVWKKRVPLGLEVVTDAKK